MHILNNLKCYFKLLGLPPCLGYTHYASVFSDVICVLSVGNLLFCPDIAGVGDLAPSEVVWWDDGV